jgi:hypothetical protein
MYRKLEGANSKIQHVLQEIRRAYLYRTRFIPLVVVAAPAPRRGDWR